jgi:hypothetical protein
MANNTYYFSGECKWAKLYKPDDKYGNYTIDVKLDEPSIEMYKKAGCQGQIKEGFVTFRRKPKVLTKKGEVWELGAPQVFDAGGMPTTDLVGNGSIVTVKVVTYPTQKGIGTRLESVKVDKLVKYEPPKQEDTGAKKFQPF